MRPSLRHASPARHGLARVLSKLGFCSRAEAARLITAGRVTLDGQPCRNPERPAVPGRSAIAVDGRPVNREAFVYVMLNKPRGLVTTATDERGRETVFKCLELESQDEDGRRILPAHLCAVGRLDQASEGLLLFTNDSNWAARLTDPRSHVAKVYHVRINRVADASLCRQLEAGAQCDGEHLAVKSAGVLRSGERNSWLEITLHEGRNRHLRRLLQASGAEVRRLVRVQVGALTLGELARGVWRHLTPVEVAGLSSAALDAPGQPAYHMPNAPSASHKFDAR